MPDYKTEVDFLPDDIFDFTASTLQSTGNGQLLMPDISETTEEERSGEEILKTSFLRSQNDIVFGILWTVIRPLSRTMFPIYHEVFFLIKTITKAPCCQQIHLFDVFKFKRRNPFLC